MRRFLFPAIALLIALFFALGQARAESGWALLNDIKIKEIEENGIWRVEKDFPAQLVNHAGAFSIEGYYVPIQAQAYVTQFLLVEQPSDCPFCGDGGYAPTLEVHLTRPLPDIPEGTALRVSGRLFLMDDPETYQSARLLDADWALVN